MQLLYHIFYRNGIAFSLSMADAVIRFGMEKKTDGRQVYTAALCSTLMGLGVLTLAMPLFNLFDMYNHYSFILYVCIHGQKLLRVILFKLSTFCIIRQCIFCCLC